MWPFRLQDEQIDGGCRSTGDTNLSPVNVSATPKDKQACVSWLNTASVGCMLRVRRVIRGCVHEADL
jgi:hypothetical protein